jgi:hypothetical protein
MTIEVVYELTVWAIVGSLLDISSPEGQEGIFGWKEWTQVEDIFLLSFYLIFNFGTFPFSL